MASWLSALARTREKIAGAVSKAMHADIIVVSARGAESLPLPFYFWVNSWLPHHAASRSLLIGLLAGADHRSPHAGRLRKYLRTVARQGRLDLIIDERQESAPSLLRQVCHRPLGEAQALCSCKGAAVAKVSV